MVLYLRLWVELTRMINITQRCGCFTGFLKLFPVSKQDATFCHLYVCVIYMFVGMCVCVCVCSSVYGQCLCMGHMCTYECIWSLDVDFGVFLNSSPSYTWKRLLLRERRACQFSIIQPSCARNPLSASYSENTDGYPYLPGFYMGPGDLNCGLHVSPREPSPVPDCYF